jgi:hypothetical protein
MFVKMGVACGDFYAETPRGQLIPESTGATFGGMIISLTKKSIKITLKL